MEGCGQRRTGPDWDFDRISLAAMRRSGLREAVEIMHVNPGEC